MDTVLAGRLEPERDGAFSAWAADRRERLINGARSRELDALLIRCEAVTEAPLALLLPVDFEARSRHRVAGGVMILAGARWAFRPDSPWEVEEARSLGLPTVDPRRCGAEPTDLWRLLAGEDRRAPRLGMVGFEAVSEETPTTGDGDPAPRRVALKQDFVVDRLRAPSPMERAEVRRVCRANDTSMRAVARLLVEAVVSEGELWHGGYRLTLGRLRQAAVDEAARSDCSFPEACLISAGASAANPHDHGDDSRPVRAGDPLVVDLFPRGHLFSDMTRTFVPGIRSSRSGDDPDLERALLGVADALEAAEAEIRDQLRMGSEAIDAHRVQKRVSEFLAADGWPVPSCDEAADPIQEGFVHGLGHGVGYRLHQAPWFSSQQAGTDRGQIRVGEAFTLEPGLYRPGAWGVRLEDVYRLEPCRSAEEVGRGADGRAGGPEVAGPLELVRVTQAPRSCDPARFLYEFARSES